MKNKKGGLELSMNSIVIIILAVVFVSLVLVFFQNVFGQQQKNVLNVIDEFPSVNPPTKSEPLKIQAEEPAEVTLGDSSARDINVEYLHIGELSTCGVSISSAAATDKVNFTMPAGTVALDDGGKVVFSITAIGVNTGTGIYQVNVCCDAINTDTGTAGAPFGTSGTTCADDKIIRSVQKAFVVKR